MAQNIENYSGYMQVGPQNTLSNYCPNCGRCSACGRGGLNFSYPYYPYYLNYPYFNYWPQVGINGTTTTYNEQQASLFQDYLSKQNEQQEQK